MPTGRRDLTDDDYRRLAGFRHQLRRYLRWAEEQAAEAGVTAAQHQLMLAIRARGSAAAPTVGDLADELLLRHHSAVGLIDRAEDAGLVRRAADATDQRVVRVLLTPHGQDRLARLASLHLIELDRLARSLPEPPSG